jgi:hypothetical protein
MVKRINRLISSTGIFMVLLFFVVPAKAQQPFVSTTVDKKEILIGEQIQFTVKIIFPTNAYKINWFNIPDSIAHFEVVEKKKIDTSFNSSTTSYEQTILLTSFDSGQWNLPQFPINYQSTQGNTAQEALSEAIPVTVGYSPADTTGQLRDIKPIMEVTITDHTWYYVAGGALLLLIIIYFIWRYLKKRPKKEKPLFTAHLSAYEEAVVALKKLKEYNLQEDAQVKSYHVGLGETFKRYVARKQNTRFDNATTGDLLLVMPAAGLNADEVSSLAAALRTGDAVKFAKYKPSAVESEESLEKIAVIINRLEQKSPTQNNKS